MCRRQRAATKGSGGCSGFMRTLTRGIHNRRATRELLSRGPSIEIDIAPGRRRVRILFGDLQHLVELLAQHVLVRLMRFDRFLESLFATPGLATLPFDGGFEVGEGGRFFVFLMTDHSRGFRVDEQLRLTAWALDLDQLGFLRHSNLY